MSRLKAIAPAAALAALATPALADAISGPAAKQSVNMAAIAMFVAFVLLTLGITYWAAKQTKSAAQFYSAGGGITGFQ
ncbi:MAG: cation acetate symporter, partial [Hyphomicrobiales bacterium]|nr:cation acetate symporter [Hyphomicrobiales bacterium]MCC2107746.1 cation acetate symporter [Hyphomicrobiales bacterium]